MAGYDDDEPAGALDDEADRDELRRRYYGLLQELRVLLPGSQIFVAFLLTVAFNSRFNELDDTGRDLYGVALVASFVTIIFLTAPTVFHRVGPRRSRSARLIWSIRLTRLGLVSLATSLLASLALVTRFVFGPVPSTVILATVGALLAVVWVALPRSLGASGHGADRDD